MIKTRSPRPSQGRRRQRKHHGHHAEARPAITLNEEGFPTALPDGPPPSPVVTVSAESRAKYPFLPARVIAGSFWRGPAHERIRVDETGTARPWRRPA